MAARPQGPSRTQIPSPRLHEARGSAAARSKPTPPPRAGGCVRGRSPVALGPPTLTVAQVSPYRARTGHHSGAGGCEASSGLRNRFSELG